MTLVIQSAIAICIAIYVSIYLMGIKRGTVKPILATWIIFSLATTFSFITDFSQSGSQGLLANSFNIMDMLACIIIFVVAVAKKDIRRSFTLFEKGCLSAVIVIFIGWLLSGQNVVAHLCLQAIMVIAYLPTLVHLWNAQKNTESFSMWSFDCVASFLGIIEPAMTHAVLPLVYSIRATLSAFAVMVLIVRLRWRKKQEGVTL